MVQATQPSENSKEKTEGRSTQGEWVWVKFVLGGILGRGMAGPRRSDCLRGHILYGITDSPLVGVQTEVLLRDL